MVVEATTEYRGKKTDKPKTLPNSPHKHND